MYTANTMASAAEALGHGAARLGERRPPSTAAATGSPARPARPWSRMIEKGITARQILTREAFENAIAVVMAFGGSTNAVLHLLAIAHEAGVPLDLDDFNRVGDRIPHLADVKPFGKYVMSTVDRVGGVPVVMKALLDAGPAARRRAHRHRQDDGREPRRARPAGPRTATCCAASTTPSTPPAASRSCTARSPRTARW